MEERCTAEGGTLIPASEFEIKNGVLISYNGNGGDIIVPDGVTAIEDDALFVLDGISVTIPSGVTSISECAFFDLSEVTIRTPKGSYAEKYAKDHNIHAELTVDGVVVEE